MENTKPTRFSDDIELVPAPGKADNPIVGDVPVDTEDADALSSLLTNLPDRVQVKFKLPSNGKAYNGTSEVLLTPIDWKGEVALKTIKEGSDENGVVAEILNRYVTGLDINYATPVDRDFILFMLRKITYGETYPLSKSCDSCKKINNINLDLGKLPVKYAEKDLSKTELTLPDSKMTCVVRHPAVKDETHLTSLEETYTQLFRFVKSVGEVTDSKIIYQFLNKTTTKDISVIHEEVYGQDYGLEDEVLFNCAECNADNKVRLELNSSFFTPS